MEKNNNNQNVKELSEEPLKMFTGGGVPSQCERPEGCLKTDSNCNCLEWK